MAVAVEYAVMGAQPSRKSTEKSHAQSKKLFNQFLGTKLLGPLLLSYSDRTKGNCTAKQVCQVSMMGELATFMRDVK